MPEYKVILTFEVYREYQVEAESEDEAIQKAENQFYRGINPIAWYEEQVDETEVEEV